jgi:hypothetical protein
MTGGVVKVNWDNSWLIETVNEAEWNFLREAVRASYEKTLKCFADIEDWDEKRMIMALGILTHTAYHLGAIRQIMKSVAVTKEQK